MFFLVNSIHQDAIELLYHCLVKVYLEMLNLLDISIIHFEQMFFSF